MYKDRVGVEVKPGDFVVYVVLGDRHPVLEFGWVVEFRETKSYGSPSGNFKIRIHRAEPNGTRENTTAVDVPAHWREDTPSHIMNYYGTNYRPTRQDYDEYYVHTTYRDTGKPSITSLDVHKGNNNRLMVTQPV